MNRLVGYMPVPGTPICIGLDGDGPKPDPFRRALILHAISPRLAMKTLWKVRQLPALLLQRGAAPTLSLSAQGRIHQSRDVRPCRHSWMARTDGDQIPSQRACVSVSARISSALPCQTSAPRPMMLT